MNIKTIAVIGTGDMGSAVGRVLVENGQRVITCLKGRSESSTRLAYEAGIENIDTLEEVVVQAELFLSILPPFILLLLRWFFRLALPPCHISAMRLQNTPSPSRALLISS